MSCPNGHCKAVFRLPLPDLRPNAEDDEVERHATISAARVAVDDLVAEGWSRSGAETKVWQRIDPKVFEVKGGERTMTKLAGKDAWEQLGGYARRTQRQGESAEEALARACSERPDLYRDYDQARRKAASEGIVPEHVRPKPEPVPRDEAYEELLSAHRAAEPGTPLDDWLQHTTEGREAYGRYNNRIIGREGGS